MTGEAVALAAIWAAYADPEPITYIQAGEPLPPLPAIRSDVSAPAFDGAGATLRKITYEVQQASLPREPTKHDRFIHRGRLWSVEDATRRDDVGAWELIVVDEGPFP